MARPLGSVIEKSKYQIVKNLLDDEYSVCQYAINTPSLRKIIVALRSKENFIIYTYDCDCGLTKRKHKCYEKDWAS